jgi:hypothetical protein
MPCNVYPAFVLPVWTSKLLNACVSFEPIALMIPPHDSFPVHLVSRHHVTAVVTKLFGNSHSTFEAGLDGYGGHAPRCSSSTADCLTGRPQASHILRVKCAQGGCNSGPNANDSFFHAWAEQRDPKLAANK